MTRTSKFMNFKKCTKKCEKNAFKTHENALINYKCINISIIAVFLNNIGVLVSVLLVNSYYKK